MGSSDSMERMPKAWSGVENMRPAPMTPGGPRCIDDSTTDRAGPPGVPYTWRPDVEGGV